MVLFVSPTPRVLQARRPPRVRRPRPRVLRQAAPRASRIPDARAVFCAQGFCEGMAAASPLELPLVLECVAQHLRAPALVAMLRVSARWRNLVRSFDGVWTARILSRWPVPRSLVAPGPVCLRQAAPRVSRIPDACAVFCARRRCESRGLELLDRLCDPRPQTPQDWSAAYCALLSLPPEVGDVLRREHQRQADARSRVNPDFSPMAREWLARRAWNAICLQQVSAEARGLAAAAAADNDAQVPIEDFPIAMAGVHHRGLGGPAGRAILTGEIDAIADAVRDRLHFNATDGGDPSKMPRRRPARVVLDDICALLFREPDGLLGGPFRGASQELYYQPSNSSLASVLRLRRGIPITLSIVLLAVARRLGIRRLFPVGAPGHFVCVYDARADDDQDGHNHDGPWIRHADGEAAHFFVDPFNGGLLLGPARMCEQLRSRIPSPPGGEGDLLRTWLQPASLLDTWVRTLNNLRGIYAQTTNNPQTRSNGDISEGMLGFLTITTLSVVLSRERDQSSDTYNLHAGRLSALAAMTLGRSWQGIHYRGIERWAGDVPNAVTMGPMMTDMLQEDRGSMRSSSSSSSLYSSDLWERLAPPPPPSGWASFGNERGPQFMVGQVVLVSGRRDIMDGAFGVVAGYRWIEGRGYQYLVLADKNVRLEDADESQLSDVYASDPFKGVDNSSLGRYFLEREHYQDNPRLQYQPLGVLRSLYPNACVLAGTV